MKQSKTIIKLALPILFTVVLLTGCWSSKDIEKLDMIIGIGVDVVQDDLQQHAGTDEQLLTVTYQLAKINHKQSINESSDSAKPYRNVEETGSSFLETARDVILKRKNILNGQHQRIILISSEVLRDRNVREILDFFFRDPEARLSCLVMVTDGLAKELLDYMETDDIPSLHIFDISEHTEKSNKLIERMTLAKTNAKLVSQTSFLLQNVILSNQEIKMTGAAVIKGSTLSLVGFLDEEDLVGVTWLTASTDGGIVKIFEEETEEVIIYELEDIKSKVIPILENGQLSFDVKVKLDGIITEILAETDDITKEENIKKLKKLIQEKVKEEIKNSLVKIQQELQVDVIGFHDYVRIKYPKYWADHKNDWDNIFSQTSINYKVDINIADYGVNINN
ncbi:Ger(x)C family spore germination protein [Sutcliffiella halmapala]|uniref:Ger(x)C family spore germination protein n=1 Tax=Sutcliffiella halmapala TaxID=79882 RepID=UPI000994E3EF|nr:Ger(x)C family spore germination protein [Sutcliffiella halmapala]